MQNATRDRKWGFARGLVAGALVAGGAGVLMAQQRGGPDRGDGEYFVTSAQNGNTGRLWFKPKGEETLVFAGDFAAVARGR